MPNLLLVSNLTRLLLAEEPPMARTVSLNLTPAGSVSVVLILIVLTWLFLALQANRQDLHQDPAHSHGQEHH